MKRGFTKANKKDSRSLSYFSNYSIWQYLIQFVDKVWWPLAQRGVQKKLLIRSIFSRRYMIIMRSRRFFEILARTKLFIESGFFSARKCFKIAMSWGSYLRVVVLNFEFSSFILKFSNTAAISIAMKNSRRVWKTNRYKQSSHQMVYELCQQNTLMI